jgi:nitrogen regulatory protein PII
MKPIRVARLTVPELVGRFAAIGIEQDKAQEQGSTGDIASYNRLYLQMDAVVKELKKRGERQALIALFDHPDMQVRLMAAKFTLAVAPERARQMLKSIATSQRQPQAGDAGMSLSNLDRGVFVPT